MNEKLPWVRWKGHYVVVEGRPKENTRGVLCGGTRICEMDDDLTDREKGHYIKRILAVPKLERENAALTAERDRLKAEVERLTAQALLVETGAALDYRDEADALEKERDALRASKDRLAEALHRYGHHLQNCRQDFQDEPCTCGFSAALAAIAPELEERHDV